MTTEKKAATEKPLDKMTVKELREIAKEMPEITGVHGMNKGELLSAIKDAKGIVETKVRKTDATVKEIKNQIKSLKVGRTAALEAKDKKMATIYRRRIARLKKKTRRSAA
jgi:predicted oxidoreductase